MTLGDATVVEDGPFASTKSYSSDQFTAAGDATFNMGTGDWTFEIWTKADSSIGTHLPWFAIGQFATQNLIDMYMGIRHEIGTSFLRIGNDSSATNVPNIDFISITNSKFTGSWTHLAIVREGTNVRAFIDGILIETETITSGQIYGDSAATVSMNAQKFGGGDGFFTFTNGSHTGLRITKGVARYTATFTTLTELHPIS